MKEKDLDAQADKVRLLFKGKELANDFHIYSYDIADDAVILAMMPRP